MRAGSATTAAALAPVPVIRSNSRSRNPFVAGDTPPRGVHFASWRELRVPPGGVFPAAMGSKPGDGAGSVTSGA